MVLSILYFCSKYCRVVLCPIATMCGRQRPCYPPHRSITLRSQYSIGEGDVNAVIALSWVLFLLVGVSPSGSLLPPDSHATQNQEALNSLQHQKSVKTSAIISSVSQIPRVIS